MADSFAVEVVTPEVTLYAGPATAVVLRTTIGSLTVLAGHAPFVGDVVPGEVKLERDGEPTMHLAVHGGFVQVDTSAHAADGVEGGDQGPIAGLSTRLTLLAGIAERAEDIDVARAQEELAQAQQRLEQLRSGGGRGEVVGEDGAPASAELVLAEAALRRAEVRLQVAGATSTT
jgi:F-type H+-transporting ATPase subunit epsilon